MWVQLAQQQKVDLIALRNPPTPQPNPQPTHLSLPQLLASQRWFEANDKTWEILIKEGDVNKNGILESSEVEKINCQTLGELDDLWYKYSKE